MAMAVGISALMKGDGVLRTQNLQRNKTLPLVLKPWRLRCYIENCVWYVFSSHANDACNIPGTPETSALWKKGYWPGGRGGGCCQVIAGAGCPGWEAGNPPPLPASPKLSSVKVFLKNIQPLVGVLITWNLHFKFPLYSEKTFSFHHQGLNREWMTGHSESLTGSGTFIFMGGLETSYFPFTLVLTLLPVFRSD